jgi:four helix bundle protein
MRQMSVIQSYRDLRVWQLAMDQAAESYRITKRWPKEETFGLISQVRRSAASVPANIAEGFGRESSGSFAQFLRNAQGSLKEYETHVLLAGRVNLLEQSVMDLLLVKSEDIGRMLGSLIRKVVPTPVDRAISGRKSRPTTDELRPTFDAGSTR